MSVILKSNNFAKFFKLKDYSNIVIIPIESVDNYFTELKKLKTERTYVDYIFTLSPYFPLYILQNNPNLHHICSLDADQYFFSSPKLIFDQLKTASVLITPHRFTSELLAKNVEEFGKFNVSFQVFKNDEYGLKCLDLWKNQCFNWCKDVLEDDKFADQKYLDTWSHHLGDKVQEIKNIGLGLAPWNINNYEISTKNKQVFVNQEKLILFHYQGLRILEHQFIYIAFDKYSALISKTIKNSILKPIVKSLLKVKSSNSDQMIRNRIIINKSDIIPKNQTSYFRLVLGELLTFDQYLKIKRYTGGILGRFKNIFRKKR